MQYDQMIMIGFHKLMFRFGTEREKNNSFKIRKFDDMIVFLVFLINTNFLTLL